MKPPVHRLSIFGRSVVCGARWEPTQKATNKNALVTCEACRAVKAEHQRAAKVRAGVG